MNMNCGTHKWKHEEILKLLNAVREHKCVWSSSHPDFKKKSVVAFNWDHIATKVGIPARECRLKFQAVRDNYYRASRDGKLSIRYGYQLKFLSNKDLKADLNFSDADVSQEASSYKSIQVDHGIFEDDSMVNDEDVWPTTEDEEEEEEEEVIVESSSYQYVESSSHQAMEIPSPYYVTIKPDNTIYQPEPSSDEIVFTKLNTQAPENTTEWSIEKDEFTISSEDFHFCNTILRTMSELSKSRKRKLQAKIYQLVVDTVTED